MKKYFTALFKSFYSPEIYRDAVVKWQGFGGKYLTFLSALLALLLTLNFILSLNLFKKDEFTYMAKQVPAMEIQDGILTVKAKQPVIIESSNKEFSITIDTTKSEKELSDSGTMMAIGKDFLFVKGENGLSNKKLDLKQFKGKYNITQEGVTNFWNQNVPIIQGLSFFIFWVGQFIDMVVECVIVAVLSYLVTAFMQEEYDFLTRMRLAVLAVTPAEILTTGMNVTVNHQAQPWLVFLLACLYIYVMIVLIRRLPPVVPAEEITA